MIYYIRGQERNVITDTSHIGYINPYRYRSYYYDNETGFYYLNSRYYNPEWGRFINADVFLGASKDILGYNLYLYGSNNPINNYDDTGAFLKKIWNTVKKKAQKVWKSAKKVVEKAWKTASKVVEKVSNAFVFEAEIGFGAGVEVGVRPTKLEVEATKTFRYQYGNDNSTQYTSTTAGASLRLDKNKVGLAIDIRNYDDGQGNPMTMPWQIWNDERTVREMTVIYKNNKYIGSESNASGGMFIGIDLGAFLGIGGRIKIGFNI